MAFLLAAPIAVADVEGGIGDITGIIGDVEGGVSDAEGATAIGLDIVGDAESAVAVGEGALADTTGVANFIVGENDAKKSMSNDSPVVWTRLLL